MARRIDFERSSPGVVVGALPGVTTMRQRETIGAIEDRYPVTPVAAQPGLGRVVPVSAYVPPQPVDVETQAGVGVERPSDFGRKVKFTPFKMRLWDRSAGGNTLGGPGGLMDMQIVKGRYIINLTAPTDVWSPITEFEGEIETKALGKKIVVEKASLDRDAGELTVQIHVVENPIPLLVLIPAAVVAVGGGIWWGSEGIENTVNSVDRVLVDVTETAWQILLMAVIALVVWKYVGRPLFKKGG